MCGTMLRAKHAMVTNEQNRVFAPAEQADADDIADVCCRQAQHASNAPERPHQQVARVRWEEENA